MSNDTLARDMSGGLSIEELDAEMAAELPTRVLLRHHRFFSRRNRFNRFNRFDHVNRFNRFNTFGRSGFGSVSNFNSTSQSIFNPQVAVNFGHGGISQFGGNTNFNSNVQFGF